MQTVSDGVILEVVMLLGVVAYMNSISAESLKLAGSGFKSFTGILENYENLIYKPA